MAIAQVVHIIKKHVQHQHVTIHTHGVMVTGVHVVQQNVVHLVKKQDHTHVKDQMEQRFQIHTVQVAHTINSHVQLLLVLRKHVHENMLAGVLVQLNAVAIYLKL
jgi:hypothetical protein